VANGNYFLEVRLDADNVVQESNDANNTVLVPYILNANPPVGGIQPDRYEPNNTFETAVNLGAQAVAAGAHDVVYAGGVESMTRVPMGADMGAIPASLMTKYDLVPQGLAAEMVAEKWKYTRQQLDEFALESQRRAWAAIQDGRFKKSIVPMTVTMAIAQ